MERLTVRKINYDPNGKWIEYWFNEKRNETIKDHNGVDHEPFYHCSKKYMLSNSMLEAGMDEDRYEDCVGKVIEWDSTGHIVSIGYPPAEENTLLYFQDIECLNAGYKSLRHMIEVEFEGAHYTKEKIMRILNDAAEKYAVYMYGLGAQHKELLNNKADFK